MTRQQTITEKWRKLPSGEMELVSRVDRDETDDEMDARERDARQGDLRTLVAKPSWTRAETEQALRLLLERLELPTPVPPPPEVP